MIFRRFSVQFAILSIILDASFTLLALVAATVLRPSLTQLPFLRPLPEIHLPLVLYLLVPLLWIAIFLIASVYDPRRTYKAVDEFQNVTMSIGVATLAFAGLLYFTFRDVSRWLFVIFILLDLCLLLGWRVAARFAFRLGKVPTARRRVLIVGAGELGQQAARMIREYIWSDLQFVGFLDDGRNGSAAEVPILGSFDEVRSVVEKKGVEEVIVALQYHAYDRLNQITDDLLTLPVQVRIVPDYLHLALYRFSIEDFGGLPLINLRATAFSYYQHLTKRAFDLIVALIVTVLSLPLMALVAIAIKLDSSGPIIFRQQRVGENGRLFEMYKFRSMVVDAERQRRNVSRHNGEGRVVHKVPNDPRVTRVGVFLRRTSIDELPQLLNVLKGDMSLVGPRPELPWLVEKYEPWQRKRFAVPQGITGWWQINGRSDQPMHLHTELDLFYIRNYSIMLDLYILWRTMSAVVRGKGAF
jgi:exopolysaccharide biosynthesis polyprenyl glycosylphosphotransferase